MARSIRRDFEVWAVARSQHDLVTTAQLRELGFTRSAISHRLRTGRLWRVYPGVFAVGRPGLSTEGGWLAAVLACGEGAALSHFCAAALLEIWEGVMPRWPQVSVPTDSGRPGPGGIELHRAATLRTTDVIERNAIPVTSLSRTVTDLASLLGDGQLKSVLRQTERRHGMDLQQLHTYLDTFPRTSYRHARARRALESYVPGTAGTEGDPEAAFLQLCADHEIPLPETQARVGRYRADFMWREINLVVEVDDRSSHDGYISFHDDRVRDRAMKAAGFDVLRFTRNEVMREARKVAREVITAIASRTVGGSRTP
jgi:hypothetical protein